MTSKKITLAIFSSTGRQRLQVENTCRASALKTKIRDILHLEEDFKAVQDNGKGRPGDKDIKLTGMTTILSMGLKNGDVIHVFPLAGTRFQETEDMIQQNGATSSSSASSTPASSTETKSTASSGKQPRTIY
jgi:hypothetical protein